MDGLKAAVVETSKITLNTTSVTAKTHLIFVFKAFILKNATYL